MLKCVRNTHPFNENVVFFFFLRSECKWKLYLCCYLIPRHNVSVLYTSKDNDQEILNFGGLNTMILHLLTLRHLNSS